MHRWVPLYKALYKAVLRTIEIVEIMYVMYIHTNWYFMFKCTQLPTIAGPELCTPLASPLPFSSKRNEGLAKPLRVGYKK